MKKELSSK